VSLLRSPPAALSRTCPGFVATGAVIDTATSRLLPGTASGIDVIAKWPVDPRPFWRDRCRHEISAYRVIASDPTPPVPTPQLVAADPDYPLLVLTRLPGTPLSRERYPSRPVPVPDVGRLLNLIGALHQWTPPPNLPEDGDYPRQLADCHGLVSRGDLDRITALLHLSAPMEQVEHGDPHFGNVLETRNGLVLLDLEFLAIRPGGYDLAKLWVLLGDDPASRRHILSRLDTTAEHQVGFWVAAVLVLCREITSHRRHLALPLRSTRLDRLCGDLKFALARVHEIHRELT
jgi:hypothetical protein